MDNKEWIKTLKVGDEVLTEQGGAYGYMAIYVVEKITPTGRIVTSNRTFNPDGWERGDANVWSRMRISPVTQEARDKIRRKEIVDSMGNIKWKNLPLEVLETIDDLLKTSAERLRKRGLDDEE